MVGRSGAGCKDALTAIRGTQGVLAVTFVIEWPSKSLDGHNWLARRSAVAGHMRGQCRLFIIIPVDFRPRTWTGPG